MYERKQAEKALPASEERYRKLVETSFDVVFSLSVADGSITDLNPAFEEITGWPHREWVGKPFTSLIHPDDVPIATEKFQQVLSGESTSGFELRVITKTGEDLLGEFIATPEIRNGKVVSVLGFARDITKPKRAEEAMRQSEKKYHDIFENVSDWIYIHDLQGVFIESNSNAMSQVGYTKSDLGHITVRDMIPQRHRDQFEDYLKRIKENGKDEGLMTIMTKDGNEVIIEYRNSLVYNPTGPIAVQGLARDITESIQTQVVLKESEEKYRTILESIEDGYYEMDISGNLTFFNDSLCRIIGYSRDELHGMNNLYYMDKGTAEKVYRAFNKVYKTGKPEKEFEYEIVRKDRTKRNIEVSASLMKNEKGDGVGFNGIIRDINEQKRAVAVLRSAHEELEKRVKERTIELAMINEELEAKSNKLEEVNVALRILLKKREEDKTELERNMLFNVRELVLPYLDKLHSSGLKDKQKAYVDIIDSNLNDIVSPFLYVLSSRFLNLTPTEIQIANFIKHGKNTKEIAELLNLSSKTVETHRKNIRKKIGIKNIKGNLRTHLLSIQ